MRNTIKGQVWFMDFVMGLTIFTLVLIAYYTYTLNVSKQDSLVMDDLISSVESLSSSLILAGVPENWNNQTVQVIGITNNNQRINKTKLLNFHNLPYNRTKKLFGTVYDYFIFFVDENETITNVEGICGVGSSEVNSTYDTKTAYYYSDEEDKFLKEYMEAELNAEVYKKGVAGSDLTDLISAIGTYDLIVMEHPDMPGTYISDLESFAAGGGMLLLSGQVFTANDIVMLGSLFHKVTGGAYDFDNATVLVEDDFFTFEKGAKIAFNQTYYTINDSIASENFTRIAEFVDPSYDEENNAVARWEYGMGSVVFFSDFDSIYFNGNFLDIVYSSIPKWAEIKCNPINITEMQYKNFVKIERILIYDSKSTRMVLYLWQ